jgi:hypothetical protein
MYRINHAASSVIFAGRSDCSVCSRAVHGTPGRYTCNGVKAHGQVHEDVLGTHYHFAGGDCSGAHLSPAAR